MKSFLRISAVTLVSAIFTFATSTVTAHHSAAPFDFSQQVTIEGIVVEFKVSNPHTAAVLVVSDNERGTREIEFEGMSASTFYRSGFGKNDVKEGDTIKLTIAPRFSGEDGGFIMSIVTSTGDSFGFRGAP